MGKNLDKLKAFGEKLTGKSVEGSTISEALADMTGDYNGASVKGKGKFIEVDLRDDPNIYVINHDVVEEALYIDASIVSGIKVLEMEDGVEKVTTYTDVLGCNIEGGQGILSLAMKDPNAPYTTIFVHNGDGERRMSTYIYAFKFTKSDLSTEEEPLYNVFMSEGYIHTPMEIDNPDMWDSFEINPPR